jgi:hypothetical protein
LGRNPRERCAEEALVTTRLFTGILISLALPGCGSSLPLDAFHEGRYPAAADELRALEREVPELPPNERARYSLYRGLTHLALGDARQADRHLTLAKRALDAHPGWFASEERGALLAAWRSIGRMPGERR